MLKECVCSNCGDYFSPNVRLKVTQDYCGKKACQSKRKLSWQGKKDKTDPDFRLKRKHSQQVWRSRKPVDAYQRFYRLSHPDYVKKNREQQGERNQKRKQSVITSEKIVKTDALSPVSFIGVGLYRLTPLNLNGDEKIVKTDALVVQLSVIQQDMIINRGGP